MNKAGTPPKQVGMTAAAVLHKIDTQTWHAHKQMHYSNDNLL
jgi:hypothetical protein